MATGKIFRARIVPLGGQNSVPTMQFTPTAAMTAGQFVYMATSPGTVTCIPVSTSVISSAIGSGLVGQVQQTVTTAQVAAGCTVEVAMLGPTTGIELPAYTTTQPTAAILGVAATTYYALQTDANGLLYVDLGTTSSGIARLLNYCITDMPPGKSVAYVGGNATIVGPYMSATNLAVTSPGCLVVIPAAYRHWNV